jgi:hypothetical protein
MLDQGARLRMRTYVRTVRGRSRGCARTHTPYRECVHTSVRAQLLDEGDS